MTAQFNILQLDYGTSYYNVLILKNYISINYEWN